MCTAQCREACWSNLKYFKIFYNNSNCIYELHICVHLLDNKVVLFAIHVIVAKNKGSSPVALFCNERSDIVQKRHFSLGNAFYRGAEPSKLLKQ